MANKNASSSDLYIIIPALVWVTILGFIGAAMA